MNSLRCPVSQARMIEVTCLRQGFGRQAEQGQLLYKTEHLPAPGLRQAGNRLGRFPEAASEDLEAGPKRNFQVFDPLAFLAEVTQHIPEAGEHLIRYYGFYSNKSRGLRGQSQAQPGAATVPAPGPPSSAKEARKRWAALIKQVYEVDPLLCPKCGAEMKIISFIERHQSEVIEKIFRHCGLCLPAVASAQAGEETPARAPPSEAVAVG